MTNSSQELISGIENFKTSLRLQNFNIMQYNPYSLLAFNIALKTHKTIMSHEFAPNLANVHFLTQDQSFGTIYRCTFVLNQTLRVSRTFLRHTFLN